MNNKKVKKAMLVYQAGIANVFAVDCFNLAPYGREAKRLFQADFRACVAYCHGLSAAGVIVRSAHCNMAGDITDQPWSDDLDSAPFNDSIINLRYN